MTFNIVKKLRAELTAANKAGREGQDKAGKLLNKARIKADKDFIKAVERALNVRIKTCTDAWEVYEKAVYLLWDAIREAKRLVDDAK